MGSLQKYKSQCRRILCEHAKCRKTITFGGLAKALELPSERQRWSTILNEISEDERKVTGVDLTLIVVHASGRAMGLGRYFNPFFAHGTALLDPENNQQVAQYRTELQKVFDTYANLPCESQAKSGSS